MNIPKLICERALTIWGGSRQRDMMIEECAELIKALEKERRSPFVAEAQAVVEELADVEIMLAQMRYLYGDIAVGCAIASKLHRLNKRIDAEWKHD